MKNSYLFSKSLHYLSNNENWNKNANHSYSMNSEIDFQGSYQSFCKNKAQIIKFDNDDLEFNLLFDNSLIEELKCLLTHESKNCFRISSEILSNKHLRWLRRFIIEWIAYWGAKLGQSIITIQTSIIYIDIALNSSYFNEIKRNKYLWGVTALILGSKFFELDKKRIKVRDLIKASKRANFSKSI